MDIGGRAIVDAVGLAGIAADDIEIPMLLELRALRRRQPFGQKPAAAGIRRVLAEEAPIEFAQRMQTRTRRRTEPNCRDHEQLRSTADQAGIEQRFLRGRIERLDAGDFAGSGT